MKVLNIIDTNQLITDADIVRVLIERKQSVIVPLAVKKELAKVLDDKIFNDTLVRKIIKAKRVLSQYDRQIQTWKSRSFGDSAIQQLILEQMSDKTVSEIRVYTGDKNLARECLEYNKSRAIKHGCEIKVFEYVNGKEQTTFSYVTELYPKYLADLDALMWRDGQLVPDINKYDSLHRELSPIATLSKKESVTKFWAWYAKANDVYRIYKKIDLHKGERISVNVLTFNNYCDMYVALVAYSESENRELKSEYVSIGSGQWVSLCLDIDRSVYSYINLDIIPMKDSILYDNFDGIYAYVDDFKVTK